MIVELALLGVGLGLFTPANNAAVRGAVPRVQSGAASGILNMTRGLGTSLGLSLTGLVFALVVALQVKPNLVAHGFPALVFSSLPSPSQPRCSLLCTTVVRKAGV